ncbi:hypothetical protein MBLNU459_g8322t1 [Dothideomycetes sp. NU459]
MIRTLPIDYWATKRTVERNVAVKGRLHGLDAIVVSDASLALKGFHGLNDDQSVESYPREDPFNVDIEIHDDNSNLCGARITIDPRMRDFAQTSSSMFALSTLGGLVLVNGRPYGLTVAHSLGIRLGTNTIEGPSISYDDKLDLGRDMPPTAYMIPIEDTFNSIGRTLSATSVRLPTAEEGRLLDLNAHASTLDTAEARELLEWHPVFAWLVARKQKAQRYKHFRQNVSDPWSEGMRNIDDLFEIAPHESVLGHYFLDTEEIHLSDLMQILSGSLLRKLNVLEFVGRSCPALTLEGAKKLQNARSRDPLHGLANMLFTYENRRFLNDASSQSVVALLVSLKPCMSAMSMARLLLLMLEQTGTPRELLPPRSRVSALVKCILRLYQPIKEDLTELIRRSSISTKLAFSELHLDDAKPQAIINMITLLKHFLSSSSPKLFIYQGALGRWVERYAKLINPGLPIAIVTNPQTSNSVQTAGGGLKTLKRPQTLRLMYIFAGGDNELAEVIDMPQVEWEKLIDPLGGPGPVPSFNPQYRPYIGAQDEIENIDVREPVVDEEAFVRERSGKDEHETPSSQDRSDMSPAKGKNNFVTKDDLSQQLYYAARNGDAELITELLRKEASVDLKDSLLNSALETASAQGHKKIVDLLLDKGANPNLRTPFDYGSVLIVAADRGHSDVVKTLLDGGADPNMRGRKISTALEAAVMRGHAEIVRLLLRAGADWKIVGFSGRTALATATASGLIDCVEAFYEAGVDINADGGTALQSASERNQTDMVKFLIEKGADVNAQGGMFGSPLLAAVDCGSEAIIDMLLNAGADLNACGDSGTALEVASTRASKPFVEFLLDKGARIDTLGRHGTALQMASNKGNEQIVEFLLARGANVNAPGREFSSALEAASAGGHETIMRLLIDAGADVNTSSAVYGSALEAAAGRGHDRIVSLLIDAGADVDTPSAIYGSALQAASIRGHYSTVELLLAAGADANARGGINGSALTAASGKGHEGIVRLLLEAGAVPSSDPANSAQQKDGGSQLSPDADNE